jgi:hypothetical protein
LHSLQEFFVLFLKGLAFSWWLWSWWFCLFAVFCRLPVLWNPRKNDKLLLKMFQHTQTRAISVDGNMPKSWLGVPRGAWHSGRGARAPLYISFAQIRVLAGEQFLRQRIAALVGVVRGAGEIIVDPGSVVLDEWAGCADREQFGRDAGYGYDYELWAW